MTLKTQQLKNSPLYIMWVNDMTIYLIREDIQTSNKHMKDTQHNCPLRKSKFKAQWYIATHLSQWLK